MGIAIHPLPIAIILPTFSLTATQYQSYFAFMITFAVMTPLNLCIRLFSGFKPIHHPNHRL
jgi:hypothetical protein